MVFADGTSYIKLQFALNASVLFLTWSSTLKQSEGSQFIVETQQDTSRYNIFRLSKNAASHHAVQLCASLWPRLLSRFFFWLVPPTWETIALRMFQQHWMGLQIAVRDRHIFRPSAQIAQSNCHGYVTVTQFDCNPLWSPTKLARLNYQ